MKANKIEIPLVRFVVKTIIALVGIFVIVMAIDIVRGGIKQYNYTYRYSAKQRAEYFANTENIVDGFPTNNVKVLKKEGVKFDEQGRGAWDEPLLILMIPTKHFIFKVSNFDGIESVFDKKTGEEVVPAKGKKGKKIRNLMKKELSEKMAKIGRHNNFQMAHFGREGY